MQSRSLSIDCCDVESERWGAQGVRELEEAHAARLQQLSSKADQLTMWWEQVGPAAPAAHTPRDGLDRPHLHAI